MQTVLLSSHDYDTRGPHREATQVCLLPIQRSYEGFKFAFLVLTVVSDIILRNEMRRKQLWDRKKEVGIILQAL